MRARSVAATAALVAMTAGCGTPGRSELIRLNTALDGLRAGTFTGTITTSAELSANLGSTTVTGRASTSPMPLKLHVRNAVANVGTAGTGLNLVYDGVATAVKMARPQGSPPWLEIQPDLLPSGASAIDYAGSTPEKLAATALVVFQPTLVLRLARGALAGSLRCEDAPCTRIVGRASRDTAWRRVHPSKAARLAAKQGLEQLGLTEDIVDIRATFGADGSLTALDLAAQHKQETGARLVVRIHLALTGRATSPPVTLADGDVSETADLRALAGECQRLITDHGTRGVPVGTRAPSIPAKSLPTNARPQ